MNNNKSKKKKRPVHSRAFYDRRFNDGLMKDRFFLSTLKPNEHFVQMNERYSGYYFLSDAGYVLSMYGTTATKLAWRKIKIDGHSTRKTGNRPAMRVTLSPAYKKSKMLYLQLEHFRPDEYQKIVEEGYHGHHKTAVACYANLGNQDVLAEINKLSNVQAVEPGLHDSAKPYQFRNMDAYIEKIEENQDSADEIIIGDLTSFFTSRLTGMRGFTIFDNKIGNCLTFFEDAEPENVKPEEPDEAAE